MLRAGQMMMAETLMRLRFGRDFKWSENDKQEELYINTVELFKDTHQSLLSIQQVNKNNIFIFVSFYQNHS
jgi:hypothetical protein